MTNVVPSGKETLDALIGLNSINLAWIDKNKKLGKNHTAVTRPG